MEVKNINKSIERARSGNTFHFLNTKYIGLDKETYKYELEFTEDCLNPFKTVQGGMIASAIDEITSISVNILTEDKYLPSSTDIHITFHRPLLVGKVIGAAKIIKLGKQIVSVEGKLFTSSGKVAASGLHTAVLTSTTNIS